MADKTTEFLARIAKSLEESTKNQEKFLSSIQRYSKEKEEQNRKLETIFKNLSSASKTFQTDLKNVSETLEQVADDSMVTNKQLDKVTKNAVSEMRKMVESTADIHPEMKKMLLSAIDSTKTFKELTEITQEFAKSSEQYKRIQENFGDSVEDARKSLIRLGFTQEEAQAKINAARKKANAIAFSDARIANKNLKEERENILKQGSKLAADMISAQTDVRDKAAALATTFDKSVIAVGKLSTELQDVTKSGLQPFKKYLSDSTKAVRDSIQSTLTVAYGMAKLWQGVKQGYEEFVKLNSVGLAGTFLNLQATATKFQVSMATLVKITEQSRVQMYRDAIKNGLTFEQAQTNFLDQTKQIADQGLIQRLGREEGMQAAGAIRGTGARTGLDKNLNKASKQLADDFLLLNSAIGISGEQYVSELESLRDLEESQNLLITANEEQRAALLASNAEIYKQGKLMGLSNAQIEQAAKARADALDPTKTAFKQRILNRILGPQMAAMMGGIISPERAAGQKQATARLQELAGIERSGTPLNEKQIQERSDLSKYIAETDAMLKRKAATDDRTAIMMEAFGNAGEGTYGKVVSSFAPTGQQEKLNEVTNRSISAAEAASKAADASNSNLQSAQGVVQQVAGFFDTALGKMIVGIAAIGGAALAHVGAAGLLSAAAAALSAAAAKLGMGGSLPGGGLPDKLGKAGKVASAAVLGAKGLALGTGAAIGYGITRMFPEYLTEEGRAAKKEQNETDAFLANKRKEIEARQSSATTPRTSPGKTAEAVTNKVGSKSANEALMKQELINQGITDPKQLAYLMGQLSHESGGFSKMTEMGSRGRPAGSQYEGRKDLGNTQMGDGEKYKGRGFIQLTGRSNYEQAGKAIGVDLVNNPEMAAEPAIAAKVAAWYLKTRKGKNGMTAVDAAASGDINALTKVINGGYNGLADRQQRTQQYLAGMTTTPSPTAAPVTPTMVATAPAVVPPAVRPVQPINNPIEQTIAENTAKSNEHLATISAGIQSLIQASSGRLPSAVSKVPQNATQTFNAG
jgi:predicted chitinase